MTTALERLSAALGDRYRVERELGQGGMATVYLAEDRKHRRQVAVKVLRPDVAAALGHERFLHEIETTASLRHPHILPLYDSGAAGDSLFYVMPYVEGESLRDRLDREKQLGLEEAVQIAREVGDALSYAHSRGVIHRDIKPENILLESGHAVVADFGIARALDVAGGARLTETGLAVGTPTYMSPEQAAGERDLDGRSDLYALGCVLYEMLAGQPPFTGPTVESVVHQHLTTEPPSVTHLRPAVPAEMAGVLQRALAKTPADRFNPVVQFTEALAARTPQGQGSTAVRRFPTWLIPAVVAGLMAVVAGVVLLRPDAPQLVAGSTRQITVDPGLEVDPAISPDGQLVAYAAGPPTAMQIYVRRVSGGRAIALTSDATRHHRLPRWTADGSEVAFQSDSTIYLAPAFGGPPRPLVRLPSDTVFGFDLSPDGRRIAYVLGVPTRIYVQEVPDGPARPLFRPRPELHSVAWSPDGTRLAYVDGNFTFVFGTIWFANEARSAVWVVPVAGGEPHRITDDAALHLSPAWALDGRALFLVSGREGPRDIYRVPISQEGRRAGPATRVTTGLNVHGMSVDRSGRRLAYSALVSHSNVWAIDVPRTGPVSIARARPVTTGSQTIEGMDVSPDGDWLVFDVNRGGNIDIYKMPTAGGEAVRLTDHPAPDFMPRWSPDGTSIVFHSLRTGDRNIYTMSADGSNTTQRTTSPAEEFDADWVNQGRAVIFGMISSETRHLRHLTLADGSVRDLPYGEYSQASPTGSDICYVQPRRGLNVLNLASGDARLLVPSVRASEGPQYCTWDPDGRTIYYLSSGPPHWSIWSIGSTGGTPRLLVDFDDPGRQHARYGFSTDGQRFYMTLGSHESDVWVMDLEER